MITSKEALERLQAAVGSAGGVGAFARAKNLDAANLSRYHSGALKLGGDVARSVGLQRVVVEAYVPIDAEWETPSGWTPVPVADKGGRRS